MQNLPYYSCSWPRARFEALSALDRQKSGTRNEMQIISLFGATSRTMRIFMPSCSGPPNVDSTCCAREGCQKLVRLRTGSGAHLSHVVFGLTDSQEGVAMHER